MDNFKILKKIGFATIICLFFYAPNADALTKAIFPDSSALQPMPKDVHPNISGNINSQIGTVPPTENLKNFNINSGDASANKNCYGADCLEKNVKQTANWPVTIFIISSSIIIALWIFFVLRGKKNDIIR